MSLRYDVEVTVISAKNLMNVNWQNEGQNNPYAVIWIDPDRKVSTRTNRESDTSSRWDQRFVLPLDRPITGVDLCIEIVHAGAENETTDPLIGSSKLPLHEVVENVGFGNSFSRTLDVNRPTGRVQGKVKVSVIVREKLCPTTTTPVLLAGESSQGQGLLLKERASTVRDMVKSMSVLVLGVAVGVGAVLALGSGDDSADKAAETKSDRKGKK